MTVINLDFAPIIHKDTLFLHILASICYLWSFCRWPFYRWGGFNVHFPNDSGGWTSFQLPVDYSHISFGKIYASPLPIFNERLAFCFTIVAIELYEFLTYFDVLIPYQIGCLQILFPILFHVFSFYSLFLFAGQKLLAWCRLTCLFLFLCFEVSHLKHHWQCQCQGAVFPLFSPESYGLRSYI